MVVETPNTALTLRGAMLGRRRWYLEEAEFQRLKAENADVKFRLVKAPQVTRPPFHRYVKIPCGTGNHKRSIVTFRSHTVAAMFCIPCERAWTEPTSHPELRDMAVDIA